MRTSLLSRSVLASTLRVYFAAASFGVDHVCVITLTRCWSACLSLIVPQLRYGGGVNRFIAAAVGGLAPASLPLGTAATETHGWRHVEVRPAAAAVRAFGSASCSRVTALGMIKVAWTAIDFQQLRLSDASDAHLGLGLNLTLPSGVSATVALPLMHPGILTSSPQTSQMASKHVVCTFKRSSISEVNLIVMPRSPSHRAAR